MKPQVHSVALAAAILAAAVSLPIAPSRAAAFALQEDSPDQLGNAFAGSTAKAYDAATVSANPAGMVRLDRSEIDAAVAGIFPQSHFSGANQMGYGATTSGTTGGNLAPSTFTAAGATVWRVAPDLTFGVSLTTPYAERLNNPTNFVGRYQSLVSSVTDEALSLAAAWRINDQISIGGGPVIDDLAVRSTAALNIGPAAALTGDPAIDVRGSQVGVGYNVGLLYQPAPDLRFGLDYHSRIQHSLSGSQYIAVPPLLAAASPATAASLAAADSAVRIRYNLPDDIALGVYWQATPQLALMSDVRWTDWSVFRSVGVVPTNPLLPASVTPENFHNAWEISVGANERVFDRLLLQTGVAFDQSPVTNQVRTSAIPDSDRVILSLGAQYDVLPNLTLQLAYAHIFFTAAPIAYAASPTSGVLVGKYSNSADTLSAGAKVKF